jgi:hypothetical protein
VTPQEIAAERLLRQRLDGAPLDRPEDVVAWLGAVQGQEYPVARWSLGLRADELTEADVDRALADGRIIRTHVLRDTWHLVAAADLRWLMQVTGPRVQQRNGTMYRRLGLDPGVLRRTSEAVASTLRGGVHATREELAAAIAGAGVDDAKGMRLAYMLMHAELELVACSGALRGRKHTYALVDERVASAPAISDDEAPALLARRYLRGHAPATARDLAVWASITLTAARRAFAMLGEESETFEDRGRTYVRLREDPPAPRPRPARAHLLQGYDDYSIAYSESRDVLDVAGLAATVPGGASMLTHTLLIDGQVLGHWRRHVSARAMRVELQLARPLDAAEHAAVDEAVTRYGRFAGRPAEWFQAGL